MRGTLRGLMVGCCLMTLAGPAAEQMPGGPPPAVGVVTVEPTAMVETTEVNGRIKAVGNVGLVARVSAFLDEQLFTDGAEVRKGDLLFRLEQAPFLAEVEARRAAVAQADSTEFNPGCDEPVIATMAEQLEIVAGAGDMGGTMRLGLYPAQLKEGTIVREAYCEAKIEERHAEMPAEHPEHRVLGGDSEIAPERELEPAGDRVALDGCEHWLAE